MTDASGGKATASVEVRVTRPLDECPTGPVRSDEFDGNALDTDRWAVLRPDAANPLSVSDGNLNLPIAQRLDVRRRHVREEHRRPGDARGRVDGDGEDQHDAR